jgi:hypothetical protein
VPVESEICSVSFEESSCQGKGLITVRKLRQGEVVHITHVWSDKYVDWINVEPNCLYNHSKTRENSEVKTFEIRGEKYKMLYALKEIEKGEELFVDYTKDTDLEQPEKNWKE